MNRFISWIAARVVDSSVFTKAVQAIAETAVEDYDFSSIVEDNIPSGISDLESRVDELESSIEDKLEERAVEDMISDISLSDYSDFEDLEKRVEKLEKPEEAKAPVEHPAITHAKAWLIAEGYTPGNLQSQAVLEYVDNLIADGKLA